MGEWWRGFRTGVLTRPLALLLLATLGAFSGFYLLLSVVPLYAAESGAGGSGAGLATGALMLSTVAAQLLAPRILPGIGYRAALASGLVLLGAPAVLLLTVPGLSGVLGVQLLRGVGFGLVTVVGSALVAELVPEERRGAGAGLYGLAVGLPSLVWLPAGVWLAENVGFGLVFVAGAVAPLAAVPAALGVSAPKPEVPRGGEGVLTGLLRGDLARPFYVLGGATFAAGTVATFVPLAAPDGGAAAAALLAQGVTATAARWLAGLLGDRYGARRLLLPGVLAAAVGVLAPIRAEDTVVLVAGMALFGAGFGALQNSTLVLMFSRVGRDGYGSASALWNVAFDAGTGVGAVALSLVVEASGFDAAFALAGAAVLCTLAALPVGPASGKGKGGQIDSGRGTDQ